MVEPICSIHSFLLDSGTCSTYHHFASRLCLKNIFYGLSTIYLPQNLCARKEINYVLHAQRSRRSCGAGHYCSTTYLPTRICASHSSWWQMWLGFTCFFFVVIVSISLNMGLHHYHICLSYSVTIGMALPCLASTVASVTSLTFVWCLPRCWVLG